MNPNGQTPIRAKEGDVKPWSNGPGRSRFDYESDRWRLEEMLNDDFFGHCTMLVRDGDWIYITDCEDQMVVVRADKCDRQAQKVWLSQLERINVAPIVPVRRDLRADIVIDPGITYRWRAARGGGHTLITRSGEVVAINFPTKDHALHTLEEMYKTGNFSPPPGREPTEQFVKGARVFRPINYGQPVEIADLAAALKS